MSIFFQGSASGEVISQTTGATSAILEASELIWGYTYSQTSNKWVHLKLLDPTLTTRALTLTERPAELTHSASFVALPPFQ